jgi:hypothetical protein
VLVEPPLPRELLLLLLPREDVLVTLPLPPRLLTSPHSTSIISIFPGLSYLWEPSAVAVNMEDIMYTKRDWSLEPSGKYTL